MRRPGIVAVTTVSLLILGVAWPVGDAVAQGKSLKEQLIGTWTLVSVHNVRNDGSRLDASGPNPIGIVIYTSDGHFAFVNTRSDLPEFAINTRDQGTPEEYKAVVQRSIAYFGTVSVNEADKFLTLEIEGKYVREPDREGRSETNHHLGHNRRTEGQEPCDTVRCDP